MANDPSTGGLEIRGAATGLLDDPLLLRVRGAGPDGELTWHARLRDDDGRVWRAAASRAEDLCARWTPAKDGTGAIAALASLRPVGIDVRVETADGRATTRTFVRQIAVEGVRTRRWRDGLAATLHVPADPAPCATVIVDAGAAPTVAALAAPLLASRGALVLAVGRPRGRAGAADPIAIARERLAAVPGAAAAIVVLCARDTLAEDAEYHDDGVVLLPPGVGAREPRASAIARAQRWDALLARLGARPRERPAAP